MLYVFYASFYVFLTCAVFPLQATGGLDRSGGIERLSPFNMLMQLRKAANHELLLPGIAYSDDTLRELSVILHNDPSHTDADPALVLTDLCSLSDHQVHKVCRLYDVGSSLPLWAVLVTCLNLISKTNVYESYCSVF